MARPEAKYRKFLLSSNISNDTVQRAIDFIMEVNRDDELKEKEYVDWKREPILLYINSFGGSIYDGLALVDIIQESKTPVYTIAIGSAMSMGLWIFLAGKKRFIGKNATLMFHDISQSIQDKIEGIKNELNEDLRLRNMLINRIVSTTAITEKQLNDYIARKAEWYIPADEAIKLKIADSYYKEEIE